MSQKSSADRAARTAAMTTPAKSGWRSDMGASGRAGEPGARYERSAAFGRRFSRSGIRSGLHEPDRGEDLPGAGDVFGELLREGVARDIGVVPALLLEDLLPFLGGHELVDRLGESLLLVGRDPG